MLKSLSLTYDAVEDRMLLRVIEQRPEGDVDHWLHLTRRVCAKWRHDMQGVLEMSAETATAQPTRELPPKARAAVSAAHHQEVAKQVPVKRDPPTLAPASVTPTLVTRVVCGKKHGQELWVVSMDLRNGQNMALTIDSRMMHGLVSVLGEQVRSAQWQLPALPAEVALPAPEPTPGKVLH